METQQTTITVAATINAAIERVWTCWTDPQHITQWCAASAEWHAPAATNDLREGGQFTTRMEARDGSMGFDFAGTYDTVDYLKRIAYTIADGRKVNIVFSMEGDGTHVSETFEAEQLHPVEMQQDGWQSILNNFKSYVEQGTV